MLKSTSFFLTLLVTCVLLCNLVPFTAASLQHQTPSKSVSHPKGRPQSSVGRQAYFPECSNYADEYDYDTCSDASSPYCGINIKTGKMDGCKSASECPSTVPGYDVVCDPAKPFCCCQMSEDDVNNFRMNCNDLKNVDDDSVWKQACSLPELRNLSVCQQSWTPPPPPPPPPPSCMKYNASGQGTKEECDLSIQYPYCGIERQTGNPVGCVEKADCPFGTGIGLVCDSATPYCCCYADPDAPQHCNDILDQTQDDAWRQACRLPELRNLSVCEWSPVPMSQGCLDYCKHRAPPRVQGPFQIKCAGSRLQDLYCPRDYQGCPPPCDSYCRDGKHLDCPDLGPPPPTPGPLVIPGAPGRAPTAPVPKEDEGTSTGEIVGIVLGVLILLLIIGVVVYCCIKAREQAPSQGPYSGAGEPQQGITQANTQTPFQPSGWYPGKPESPLANTGATQSAQFAPQQAGTVNYNQQGATSSMPNMSYQ